MEAEEAKAEQARVAEDKKKASADQKAMKAMSKTDKVARLEQLLSKSIAYSEFLASKIKKEGEKGAKAAKGIHQMVMSWAIEKRFVNPNLSMLVTKQDALLFEYG